MSSPGVWNRLEYRPLEGFVFAVTPFNFTAIGGEPADRRPRSWATPSSGSRRRRAAYSAHWLMKLYEEAGLPPGVINLVYGTGARGRRSGARAARDLAGVHFTGSTAVFNGMWKTIGDEHRRRHVPQLPAHRRRDGRQGLHRRAPVRRRGRARGRDRPRRVRVPGTEVLGGVARVRPVQPLARAAREARRRRSRALRVGDVGDFSNFMGAVIDGSSFKTQREAIEEAKASKGASVLVGGGYDDSDGWFVEPTVVETSDPDFRTMREELFGPVRHGVRLRREALRRDPRPDRRGQRRTRSPARSSRATAPPSSRRRSACATRPATSTSTTSRPAPSSGSSRSAARARRARTTRPARCGT